MLALLISGIGIMNIMLVSVTERTREIGIRKAVGAQRREVLCQFLLEAILISGIGAITGIAIAVTIPFLIEALLRFLPVPGGLQIPISWISVVLAFVSTLRHGRALRVPAGLKTPLSFSALISCDLGNRDVRRGLVRTVA